MHRVQLGTGMEGLEQLPRQIVTEITQIGCQLYLSHLNFALKVKVINFKALTLRKSKLK